MDNIILVGNPNVGKSLLFHGLTGQFVTVSNYPGTTVELTAGTIMLGGKKVQVIDTPGMYSLYPITEEERVARDVLLEKTPRWVCHVTDGKNLGRMLPLTLELISLGFPIILVVNMLDEAKELGITIDFGKLRKEIGVPVVGTISTQKIGIDYLKHLLTHLEPPSSHQTPLLPRQFDSERIQQFHKQASRIIAQCVTTKKSKSPWTNWDKILLSPLTGTPILLAVLYFALFKVVGQFGAGYLVDFLDQLIFQRLLNPYFGKLATHIPWPAIRMLLVGEYGIFTLALRYAFAVILPIVGSFFFVFALLEDSGYLPRLSLLVDRVLKVIGLSGRGIIPLVLGLGCGTMATVVTRTLESKRERKIATFILALAIPCSAQLGLFLSLLTPFPQALAIWLTTIILTLTWIGAFTRNWPGETPTFYMELPPLRIPRWHNIIAKTMARMQWYLWEVIPIFIMASIILWLTQIMHFLPGIIAGIQGITDLLGLPKETALIFFYGFFRRDYGAAGLYDLRHVLTWQQLTVTSVTLTLFVPCAAQLSVIFKERGLIYSILSLSAIILIALGTGFTLRLLIM